MRPLLVTARAQLSQHLASSRSTTTTTRSPYAPTWNKARLGSHNHSRVTTQTNYYNNNNNNKTISSSSSSIKSQPFNSSCAAHSTTAAPSFFLADNIPALLLSKSSSLSSSSLSSSSSSPAAASASPPPLSYPALYRHFITAAIPMVGFGFMDNVVMIQAGQYIDSTLGVQFGLATLTAAAAGQVVSDVSGVLFGGTLERVAVRYSPWLAGNNHNHPSTVLTAAQRQLPTARNVALAGAVVGVIVGCAAGASTLWWVDLEARDKIQHARQLRDITADMIRRHNHHMTVQQSQQQQHVPDDENAPLLWLPHNLVCTIHVASERHFTLPNQPDDDDDADAVVSQPTVRLSWLRQARPAVRACAEAHGVHHPDPNGDARPSSSSICAPIRAPDGTVLAVLELSLLLDNDNHEVVSSPTPPQGAGFTHQHVQTVQTMAHHLGIVLKHLLDD